MKIISGGQTGADRAALDAATQCNIETGGYCTKGRRAEDGAIPHSYHLKELSSKAYHVRTEKNVTESDGTVIFTRGKLTGGSKLTNKYCRKSKAPALHINSDIHSVSQAAQLLATFIASNDIAVLNAAGQRASHSPGIYQFVFDVIVLLARKLSSSKQF